MKLILAEKPSLAKEIAFAILDNPKKNKSGFWQDNDIIVANLVGHVLEYEYPGGKWEADKLPLDIDLNKLIPKKDKKALVKTLTYTIKSNDVTEIISAGDADQEGSLLIYEILLYAGAFKLNKKLSRIWILAMDKKTIKEAWKNRFDYKKDKPFILAGQSRTFADAYVGLNLTQIITLKFGQGNLYSVGRVQTPTLQLVRKREIEIENFLPRKYSTIKGNFAKDENNFTCDYFYFDRDNKKNTQIFNTGQLDEVIKTLNNKNFIVKEKTEKEIKVKPDFLPNLNDILKNISKLYKYKAKQITADIQILYEKKLISYPRSECRYLPTSMYDDISKILHSFPEVSLSCDVNNKRVFNDAKIEAHYAIIPLKPINVELTETQEKIYHYIKDKFLMAFMPDYRYMETLVILSNSDNTLFQTKGRIEIEKGFKGYRSILNKDKEDIILPDLSEGDNLILNDYKISEDITKPPALLTEATLLAQMENIFSIYKKEQDPDLPEEEPAEKFSLGTPATRGAIIETLFKREFMTSDKKGYLSTTDKGKNILDIINDKIGIKLTATFENKLDKIRKGKFNNVEFKNEIRNFTNNLLQDFKSAAVTSTNENLKKTQPTPTGEICPECGQPLVIRKGKYGPFTACSNYPTCKYIKKEKKGENTLSEGEISEFSKGYKTVKDGQEYIIWKKTFGVTISQAKAKKLFNGEQLKLNNLKSKTGKTYSATAEYNFEDKKIKLIFDK